MNFIPLASSSAGNAYVVEDGKSRILIECGVPYKRLQKLMGFEMAGISGCLLSHEHHDHAKCHMDLIKNGIPVYASESTVRALDCDALETLGYNERWEYAEFSVGSFDVKPFSTFHDAAEPVGYLIRSREDGERLMFATDTVNLAYAFHGLSLVALECNHSDEILSRSVKMPEKTRVRISNTHMNVERTCAYLRKLDLSQCRTVYLLHLSDACSNERELLWRAKEAAHGVEVIVCHK